MKEMLKLGLVLACFAAVACVALAFVNNLTAPTIAKVEAEKANAGMKAVFTDADYFMDAEGFTSTVINGVTIDKVCYAYKNDEKVGEYRMTISDLRDLNPFTIIKINDPVDFFLIEE